MSCRMADARHRNSLLYARFALHWWTSRQFAHELGISIDISEHDDLADLRVLVIADADSAGAAPIAPAAADAETHIGLRTMTFFHGNLLGRAHIRHREQHIGRAAVDAEATQNCARAVTDGPPRMPPTFVPPASEFFDTMSGTST